MSKLHLPCQQNVINVMLRKKMSLICGCGKTFFSFVLHMKKMPKAFINIMRILQPLLTNCQTSVLKYCREIFQRNISLIYESRY